MLAQNFKTAAELGIPEIEHDALRKVLGMLERGEIKRHKFDMTRFSQDDCSTACCLAGWARIISPNTFARFGAGGDNSGLGRLFYPARDNCSAGYDSSPAQAAIALRNYLTHGEPRWAEALAAVE
jgi:hypothetical protein